jgi:hypothetical protein
MTFIRIFLTLIGTIVTCLYLLGEVGVGHFALVYGPYEPICAFRNVIEP